MRVLFVQIYISDPRPDFKYISDMLDLMYEGFSAVIYPQSDEEPEEDSERETSQRENTLNFTGDSPGYVDDEEIHKM
jgi:hypothetical protein